MLKNSFRQLFRTKIKTALFFCLMVMCALLICLGSNLVKHCQVNLEQFKDVFVTIGLVEQEPIRYENVAQYDAEFKNYTYNNRKQYGEMFSLSELNMEGINYICGPERRAYYGAYLPGYKIYDDNVGFRNEVVMEISPLEDGLPVGPLKVRIKKIIYSLYPINEDVTWICDHFNDNPQMMYADKTYLYCGDQGVPHNWRMGYMSETPDEYVPVIGAYSTQSTKDGVKMETELPLPSIEEINEEYYRQGHDKYWEAYAIERRMLWNKVPVTATDDLNLIVPFYNHDVGISSGRMLDEADFTEGKAVCIISRQFARRNRISVGDTITLPLRTADYSGSPGNSRWFSSPMTADGKPWDTFYTDDYTIVGIYDHMSGGGTDKSYELAENEIIVPQKSIKADDSNNIADYGSYISPTNTAFRIPNGTIDEFMEEWEKKGIEDVTIHFYDRGYSQLEDGIHQMERMAVLLLVAGIMMTILVLVFFCQMMIGGQKRRTAIERSLGAGKWQCMKSILSGILFIALVGCLVGCLTGAILTKKAASALTSKQVYNRLYSAGVTNSETDSDYVLSMEGDVSVTLITFGGLFLFTVAASSVFAYRNLKEEPLALLSEKGD